MLRSNLFLKKKKKDCLKLVLQQVCICFSVSELSMVFLASVFASPLTDCNNCLYFHHLFRLSNVIQIPFFGKDDE